MKRERKAEIHYYEWSVARWLASSTRDRLDAAGRAIYREMLDRCYVQGSVPADRGLLAKIAGATAEEIDRNWPTIRAHFQEHPRDKGLLVNKHANVYRKQFFRALKRSQINGERGGRPTATQKANKDSEIETHRLLENNPKRKGKERKEEERKGKETREMKTETPKPPPPALDENGRIDPSLPDVFEQLCGIWIGPISDMAARNAFVTIVSTPELVGLILENTPGWTRNPRYRDGFHDLTAYIRSKVWTRPAPSAASAPTARDERLAAARRAVYGDEK